MRRDRLFYSAILGLLSLALFSGCGSDNKTATSSLTPFQPEIINSADNFSFQATDVENVTTSVSYVWSNSGSQASVDHSSVISDGLATVRLYDHNDSLVYSSGLVASANEPSDIGVAGNWRVVVNLSGCSGTLNFRAQKLN